MYRLTMKNSVAFAAIGVASLFALAGCSSDDPKPTVPPNPTSTPRPTATAVPTPTATPGPTATPSPSPTPRPTAVPTPTPTPQPPDAAFLAIFSLADHLNVPPNTIAITGYERSTWPSSAYGCPAPGNFYLQVVTNGWTVTFEVDGKSFEYHTDESGETAFNCTENFAQMANAINVVELARLRTATEIEMRRRDGTGEYALKATVTEADAIRAIVDTLDVPVLPEPAASCRAVFQVVFVTPSGNQTISTICGGNNRLIRGDQSFWGGQDANAPSEFSTIIGPYFSDEPLPAIPTAVPS